MVAAMTLVSTLGGGLLLALWSLPIRAPWSRRRQLAWVACGTLAFPMTFGLLQDFNAAVLPRAGVPANAGPGRAPSDTLRNLPTVPLNGNGAARHGAASTSGHETGVTDAWFKE